MSDIWLSDISRMVVDNLYQNQLTGRGGSEQAMNLFQIPKSGAEGKPSRQYHYDSP